jgi:hypothetical protein
MESFGLNLHAVHSPEKDETQGLVEPVSRKDGSPCRSRAARDKKVAQQNDTLVEIIR